MNTPDTNDLPALVQRVAHYQNLLGLNDAGFCRRYRQWIGSPDVWARRLKAGNFGELDQKKWSRSLTALINDIEGVSHVEEFFDELPFAEKFLKKFEQLIGQRTDRRCMITLAVTGCGKSTTAGEIKRRVREAVASKEYPAYRGFELVSMQADESWKNNKFVIYNAMLNAMGHESVARAGAAFITLRDALKLKPCVFLIDDAHEGGATLFKLIKTLIDQTSSRFCLMAYPSSWKRLIRSSDNVWAEAQQLLGRTMKPVFDEYQGGTTQADLEYYFKRAAGTNGDSKALAAKLLSTVQSSGNLRFIADVVLSAQLDAAKKGSKVSTDLIDAWAQKLAGVAVATDEQD